MPEFNPYHKWLGIPKDEASPTYYQILGVPRDETDRDVINAAAVRQSMYVRNFQKGPQADEATRVLAEIEEAKLALLDPEKRKAYDQTLEAKAVPPAAPASVSVVGPKIRAKPRRIRRYSPNRNIGIALTTGALVAAVLLTVWVMNERTPDTGIPTQDAKTTQRTLSERQAAKKSLHKDAIREWDDRAKVTPPKQKPPTLPVKQTLPEPSLAIAPFDATRAKKHQQVWADYLGIQVKQEVDLGEGVKLTMMLIPPGEFLDTAWIR